MIAGCQSSQLPDIFQGDTVPLRTSEPPPEPVQTATRTPQQKAPAPAARPAPGRQTAARPVYRPPAAGRQQPSLTPYLTRPRPGEAMAPQLPPAPPPPRSGAVRIAILLPLSGPQAHLGQGMLNAAQQAMFDFSDKNFELLPHDTRGTPEGAAEAAQLAIGDGAAIILGPLLAASVKAIKPAVAAAGIPAIAFSNDRGVAGNRVFTMGFLPGDQVKRVVRYARSRGIARFAALAPDNDYGSTVVEALYDAAAESGGEVTVVQFYNPHAKDYSGAVKRLANYETRRASLVFQRKELKAKDDELSKRALKRMETLQTLGDLPFEALLVADGGKRLQNIAAHLPFYDIDPAKVRMLGTGYWEVAGVGAEPALTGGWFAASPPALRGTFEAQYKKIYGRKPPRLATLAYDATALAAVLARADGGPDFSLEALTDANGFAGRDGIFRFRPSGIVERGLAVLRVGQKGSKVIEKAPTAFPSLTN